MPRSPFPKGAGEDRETGVGQNRGRFADVGVPSRRPSPPSRPCRGSDTPFCPLRAQAGLGDGARGALAHHGGNITRCSFAPNSPLPSQHIPPTLQNGRRPPASPSPSEPGVGSLAPVCGPSGRVKSRWIFRALLAAPVLLPSAVRGRSGGRWQGRRGVIWGERLHAPPAPLFPTSCMVSGERGPCGRRARVGVQSRAE